jgi:O-antigen/teichoic acid export membrane protein
VISKYDGQKDSLREMAHRTETGHRATAADSKASHVASLAVTRTALLPLSVAIGILVTRQLGPEHRGAFALATLMSGFGVPLVMLGFAGGVRFLVASKEWTPQAASATASLVSLVLGTFGALAISVGYSFDALGETARILEWRHVIPVLCSFPLVTCGVTLNWILIGDSRFHVSNMVEIARQAVTIVLLVILVLLLNQGLFGAILAVVAGQIFFAATLALVVTHLYQPSLQLDFPLLRRGFSYGIRSWIGSLAVRTNDRLDQLVLVAVSSPLQVGIYSVAVRIAELPQSLSSVVVPVLFNRLAESKDTEEKNAILCRIHRLVFWTVFFVLLALASVGHWTIPLLYGSGFAKASLVLILYLPGVLTNTSLQLLGTYFGSSGLPGIASRLQLIGLTISAIAFPLLVPAFGAKGAAVGSSIAYLGSALAAHRIASKQAGFSTAAFFNLELTDIRWGVAKSKTGITNVVAMLPAIPRPRWLRNP